MVMIPPSGGGDVGSIPAGALYKNYSAINNVYSLIN